MKKRLKRYRAVIAVTIAVLVVTLFDYNLGFKALSITVYSFKEMVLVLPPIFIGSAAAGPLYGAFPVATVFMKKGVKFSNILIFIGAWSTTKVPMILFEVASLGTKFAVTRLLIDLPGIIIIAWVLNSIMSKEGIETIYKNAERVDD